jgi:DNA-binding NtrC family response regulator
MRLKLSQGARKLFELYRIRREEGCPFKAVILDIYQPEGIRGRETMRHLLEYDPEVKAIASSGLTDDKTMIEPEKYGFLASLPKPYQVSQLSAILRDIVGTGQTGLR